MIVHFNCNPKKNKALCCKEKNITLEIFIDEMKLFEPDKAVFILFNMGFNVGEDTLKLPYSITNPTFYKKSEIRVNKIVEVPTTIREITFVKVWFPGDRGCYHLGTDNKCSIYKRRPIICRAYPFINSEKEFSTAITMASPEEKLRILRGEKKYLPLFFSKCRECCEECFSKDRKKGFVPLDKLKNKVQKEVAQVAKRIMKNHRNYLESFYRKYMPSYLMFLLPSLTESFNKKIHIYSPILSAALIREMFGEKEVKDQAEAVRKLLNGRQLNDEEKKMMNIYLKFLEDKTFYENNLKEDEKHLQSLGVNRVKEHISNVLAEFETLKKRNIHSH
jgi:Fe-S-cluster containining protein